MSILDFIRGTSHSAQIEELRKRVELQVAELEDVRARLANTNERSNKLEEYLRTRRTNLPKPIQYSSRNILSGGDRRNHAPFEGPIYDLSEIARALDVEAYIATSVRKHREQILKEGFTITGQTQETIDYINKRLFEFSLVTGLSFDEVVREYTTNLVQYATSFIVKQRDDEASSGKRHRWGGKELSPIAGIFPMDPSTVGAQQNQLGHVANWMQKVLDPVTGQPTEKKYKKEDIVVATIDKKSGFVFGTPYILPVLDDVRTLRRIEEISEIVAQRHAFPWVHWRVGSDDRPADIFEDGTGEVDLVRAIIETTPPEGGIVTDHRVESEVLGMKGEALDLVPYLEYYEKRVMAGLRLSSIDLGRTEGSKSNAVTVSETLQDASKDFQAVIANSLSHQLFVPLLLEGGFDVNIETMVTLEFKLINREEERARISHGQDLFLGGSITRNEFRRDYINKKDMSEEEDADTLIGRKERHDMELAKLQAAAKAAQQAATAAKNKTGNKTRPKNQYGQKPAKTRVKANDSNKEIYLTSLIDQWKNTQSLLIDYVKKYSGVVEDDGSDNLDVTTRDIELTSILTSFVTLFSVDSKSLLLPMIIDGTKKAADDASCEEYTIANKLIDRFIKNNVTKSLNKFISSVKDEILSNDSIAGIQNKVHPQTALASIVDNRIADLVLLSSKHINMAFRFGYVKAARSYGYDSVILSPIEEGACDACIEAGDKAISLTQKDIPYNILLDTHSTCKYEIFFNEE